MAAIIQAPMRLGDLPPEWRSGDEPGAPPARSLSNNCC
jgi:hypothetical protein